MNRSELAAALDRVGVTSGYYIDGLPPVGTPDNALHLRHEPDGCWVVAYFERGTFNVFQRFDAESEACEFMFMTIVSNSYWSSRVRLTQEEKIRADAFYAEYAARVRAEAEARRLQAGQEDGPTGT